MPQSRYKLIWLGLFLSACLGRPNASACNVPVFRYALERWTPDRFVVVVFHKEPFTAGQQVAIDALQSRSRSGLANLVVRPIDVSGEVSPAFRPLWEAQQKPALPWMVVRYPAQTGIEPSLWAGPLSAETVTNLIESPARREIARRLLAGDTAVWLLLESGDKQRDDALERALKAESTKLAQTLELPETVPGDPEISPDPPLRIAFSTLRITRSEPAESLFIHQLLSWHPSLGNDPRAMLFPVFGRGRVLPPALGEGIRAESIDTIARLLTGPCSCQIKEMNAGFDLLMTIDWDKLFQGRQVKPTEPLPLVGISRFADRPTNNPASLSSVQPAPALSLIATSQPKAESGHLSRNLSVLAVAGVLLVGLTTFFLRARSERASG